jgi:hypothetical protein
MKLPVILFLILLFSKESCSQTSLPEDKSFTIILYIQKERDSVDTLKFQNNTLNFSSSKKYGFVTESLKVKEKNGNYNFTAVCKSKKNGVMIWDGKVMQDSIAGTLIWDTKVQNPVNYTFTGKESVPEQ